MENNSPGHRHVIAVIIDDGALRDSVRVLLEGYGFAVAQYASSTSYLRKPCEGCVLVIDFALGELSGLDLAEVLRSGEIETPIVFMVDVVPPGLEARLDAISHCTRLNKPVSPAALINVVAASCSQRGMREVT